MRYIILAVASDVEAERLIQDLTENPDEPLRTPRWGNAVYAELATTPTNEPVDRPTIVRVTASPNSS